MGIREHKKVSQAFRRLSSNMLKSKESDKNIHLIRFRKFIQENELINNIIQEKIKDIDYDYKDNFIVKEGSRYSISIPIDNGEHIKAMYDYLIDMTNEEKNIFWIAYDFFRSSGTTWDDMISQYLDKIFKPLVDFIVDSLSLEMMGMENMKQEIHIYPNINKNYGTVSIAQGNIESVNNVTLNDLQVVKELVESLKDLIIEVESDEELKEEVIYDLEDIEQEINTDNPKWGKIRKAWKGIKSFVSKIPEGLTKSTIILTQCEELYEKLKPFIEK